MADAFTDTTQLTQATTAYERLAYFPLRAELYFPNVADIKPTRQSHPGSAVLFNIYNDMAPAVTPISQTVDIDAVAITDAEVTVSLNEYGNAAISSARIRGFSYLVVSSDIANVIGFNAGLSFDCLARNPLLAGTNIRYAGAAVSRVTVAAGHILAAVNVRRAATDLTNRNVQRVKNGLYVAYIAPDAAFDLRGETGAAAWRDPHVYSQPEQIWNGEVGAFEGFAFMETPRLNATATTAAQGGPGGFENGGVGGTVDVYPTLFMGKQALAKTWSSAVSAPTPQIVLGAVVDKLQRFVPVGWYWLGGFGRFREDALVRVESSSSIGAN